MRHNKQKRRRRSTRLMPSKLTMQLKLLDRQNTLNKLVKKIPLLKRRSKMFGIQAIVSKLRSFVSQPALVVLPLFLILGACGKYAELLEAPKPIVKLVYLNPPLPSPVIQPKSEVAPINYWKQKNYPLGDLMCMPSQNWINVRAYRKEIAHWMKSSVATIKFHEKQNSE